MLEEIAELAVVGKRTVQRVAGEPTITDRVSDRVAAWLEDEPGLLSVELLRRAKPAGYDGAKSALYAPARGGTVRSAPEVLVG